jgi:outer membrane protein OmpA-like peptidoglycan-associated protein
MVPLYIGGKKAGQWLEYKFQDKVVTGKLEYNAQGVMFRRTTYIDYAQNKLKDTYTYDEYGALNGPAKEYSNGNVSTYASGSYANSRRIGVCENSMLDKNDNLVYARGAKVEYEAGIAVSFTDSAGKVRLLKEEARANQALLAKYEADKQAAVASTPKHYDRISVRGIDFTPDSYLLTENGKEVVASIAHAINERAASPQKVSTIYLSGHTERPYRTPSDTIEKMMYILSLNRAFAVKKMLQEQITDKTCRIVAYGCAGTLPTQNGDQSGFSGDARVQMLFDDPLPNAAAAYTKLVNKYGIQMADNILPNGVMRRSILRFIDAYFQDDQLRQGMLDRAMAKGEIKEYFYKIPLELWLQTPYSERYGEANPSIFRTEVERRFAKWSKEYDLMSENQGKGISPKVLFHKDLEQHVAKSMD